MSAIRHKVAVNTGGGDCPGLNAVIRAIVKRGRIFLHWDIVGIEDSFDGLLSEPRRVVHLTRKSIAGALTRGGTLLGSTNRGNPFALERDGETVDLSQHVTDAIADMGCEGLIALGGDGSMAICNQLVERTGLKVIGVPKTIDNDLVGTDETFGFNSAVEFATLAVDRLHSTAESHDRVMVLEVMGRDAGFIALHAGVAGGADAILIPEIPFDLSRVADKILERKKLGRWFSIVVVAEGARPKEGEQTFLEGRRLGGVGYRVTDELSRLTGFDARCTVLGHLQRGGVPSAYDRILATRLGSHAVDLVEEGRWNRLVVIRNDVVTDIPLADAVGATRGVDPDHDLVKTARGIGIVFGD